MPVENAQLARLLRLLEEAVSAKDTKLLLGRLLRQTAAIRKELSPELLKNFVEECFPIEAPSRKFLLERISEGTSVMEVEDTQEFGTPASTATGLLPETEAYAFYLVLIYLSDKKEYEKAKSISSAALAQAALYNRRTLDGIMSKVYFYYSWVHECTDSLQEIRGQLLALHRTAVLRHDDYGQETLLNLLLRNYLHYNLYDQAEKLRSKAQKNDVWRSIQQLCRYLFYLGRIRAIQLDYTDAKDCLQQAARKAPAIARGFRVAVAKWLVVVRLLLGEIPEHSEFQQAGMQKALTPYFALTQAVRSGDLKVFMKVSEEQGMYFQKDKTHNMIIRLRHNVIKSGLRRINLAYSRIHLSDIAKKLGLQSTEDTESVLAKAIRDGGIDATIAHEKGVMLSKDTVDLYSSSEPQTAFHARVAFCIDIHNEAVKAMRFENAEGKNYLETAETTRERAIQDEELAKQIQEESDDY